LLISPTIVLLGIFVYVMIGLNFSTAMTKDSALSASEFVGLQQFTDLLTEPRFLHSLANLGIFTLFFMVGTMLFGFLWAWMLDKGVTAEGVFRSIYLFPMAVSFVASGVVWRWLLSSAQGVRASRLHRVLQSVGPGSLQSVWYNQPLWGMAAMAMPAILQLSGYVMALFLPGWCGIPEQPREAARLDGASEWKLDRYVAFPQL